MFFRSRERFFSFVLFRSRPLFGARPLSLALSHSFASSLSLSRSIAPLLSCSPFHCAASLSTCKHIVTVGFSLFSFLFIALSHTHMVHPPLIVVSLCTMSLDVKNLGKIPINLYIHVHPNICTLDILYEYAYTHIYTCIYVHICTCVYIYIYIYV